MDKILSKKYFLDPLKTDTPSNLFLLLKTWRKQSDGLCQKGKGERVAAALEDNLSEPEPRVGALPDRGATREGEQ